MTLRDSRHGAMYSRRRLTALRMHTSSDDFVIRKLGGEAAHRLAADKADREAWAPYTARVEREGHAQTEPAAERQAGASEGIEIKM